MPEQAAPDYQRETNPELTPEEEQFLDSVLDRAVDLLHAAATPMAAELAEERPYLLAEVEAQLHTARMIVPRAGAGFPTIKGYTLLSEVGRGGMGTVYQARQERLGGRSVALKVLSESSSLSLSARRRFRQESEAIARLRHPHIVGVHDVVENADPRLPPAFAMEWVEGRSLAAVIEHVKKSANDGPAAAGSVRIDDVRTFVSGESDKSAPADGGWAPTYIMLVCRIGIAIARALGAVHRAGLVHRDVKPSNVLIRRDGVPLLTDFGLARDVESEATLVTQAGQFVGTPAYAAPEQLRGDAKAQDSRSDVYSLGAMLYHALALRLPFEGQGTTAILRKIESGRCAPLRAIDRRIHRDLETIVAKAMEADPERRYQAAEEVAEDLERLVSLRPIRARRAGLVNRARKAARRNHAALVGATAGALATLLLALTAVAYTVVVPRRVADHLHAAQFMLLDPDRIDKFVGAVTTARKTPAGDAPSETPESTIKAIAEYDAALYWAPGRGDIRLEREAVVAARDARTFGWTFEPDNIPSILLRRAPGAVAYLLQRAGGSPQDSQALDDRSPEDLRTTGLIAFLLGDAEYAFRAWDRLVSLTDPDPLVQAALADLHTGRREWAAAYVRMHRAVQAFPDSDLFRLVLADAALHVDLPSDADRLLREVGENPRGETFDIRRRVLAGLHARRGEDAEAIEQFEFFRQSRRHPAAREEYGRFLMSRGRFRDAAVVFQEVCAIAPARTSFRRLFLEACQSWLGAADEVERARAREGTLEGMHRSDCTMALFDTVTREEPSLPPAKPPLERAKSRSPRDGTLPPALDWLNQQVDGLCGQPR